MIVILIIQLENRVQLLLDMEKHFDLHDEDYFEKLSLQKKDIKRIEIISLQKAPTLYGSAGKNGVINIYTYAKPSNNKTTANRR